MAVAERRRKTLIGAGVAAFAVALLGLIVFLILVVAHASTQIAALDAGKDTQDAQIQGLAGAVNSARAQIKGLGATPVVPAPSDILKTISVSGPAGPAGSPGAAGVGASGPAGPGPSDAQVESAVSAYLAAHPVPGVSTGQVESAVDAYFVASPPPSGPAGPGPSQQQIADAVAVYMAANPAPSGPAGSPGAAGGVGPSGPVGPEGPPGNPGENGAPGGDPAGWSWTDPSGNVYTCAETSQTPAPNYSCTLVPSSPPPSPPTSPSTGPSDGGDANAADAQITTTYMRAAPTPAAPSIPKPRALLLLALPLLRRDELYAIGDA